MAYALELARRGRYSAHPNPMVGCVLVDDGEVVGFGWHVRTGDAHAEVNALEMAGERSEGATAYVTLEPCAHQGRTPPCTDALIAARVRRVVVAIEDPNPAVSGKGIAALRAAGVDVDVGLLAAAAAELNVGFLSRVSCSRPYVQLKIAASLDGAVAMTNGESQWVTGQEARTDVQRLRASAGAVMTGVGTMLADDPSLTVRDEQLQASGEQPLRVILDSALRTPPSAKMLALPGTTILCHCSDNAGDALLAAGAELQRCEGSANGVDIDSVLANLAKRGVNRVLVESGPRLAGSLLESSLVDELVIYQAPHIMGSQTRRMIETPNWTTLTDRLQLTIVDVRRIGVDTRITAKPERSE